MHREGILYAMGAVHELAELRDRAPVFDDRAHAGRVLAALLRERGAALEAPILLAVPAGGVPVAATVADELGWTLELCVVSKITLPWNSEAGYGAVAFDGSVRLNDALIGRLPLTERMIAEGIAATRAKVQVRDEALRRGRPPLAEVVAGRIAVTVDDGLASGFTLFAALEALRRAGVGAAVVAVPTGSADSVARIAAVADAVYCANVRAGYPFAVADAYRHWHDVGDAELQRCLERLSR